MKEEPLFEHLKGESEERKRMLSKIDLKKLLKGEIVNEND